MGGTVVSVVAWQRDEFLCSPAACVCFLQVLYFPPTVQKHADTVGH